MKNGWKKMPISHGFEKTTRIQTKRLFCLQEEHRPKCNGRVSLGEPYERQEARRISKKSSRQ